MATPRTSRPFTYCIDYGGHRGFIHEPAALLAAVTEAPPHLMHLGHDVPIPNTLGPIVPGRDGALERLTPEAVRQRTERIADLLRRLRFAGCRTVIPYVCNQTVMGDPDKRLGIWEFYDHWDEYAELGVGPRPAADPLEWMAREPEGRVHFNYEKRHSYALDLGMYRWAPCLNNPWYNQYQRVVVSHLAQVGYDGVFVDNNNLNCYCAHCQEGFRAFLASRFRPDEVPSTFGVESFADLSLATRGSRLAWAKKASLFREYLEDSRTDAQLLEFFGTTDLDCARLEEAGNGWLWGAAHDFRNWLERRHSPAQLQRLTGLSDLSGWGIESPQDRLLWAETKRFWATSVCRNLTMLGETGRRYREEFVVTPNWGNLEEPDAAEFREEIAHIGALWAPGMDFMMFEEGSAAGAVAPGLYTDHVLQYRMALALGIEAAVLPYGNLHEGIVDLGHAENVAHGGAAYIQPGTGYGPVRARWRAFLDRCGDLLAGATPHSEVAVAYLFDELILENPRHPEWVYRLVRCLSDQHVLFDIVTERQLGGDGLEPYGALILPDTRYLSDAQIHTVRQFIDRGGVLIAVGNVATHTPLGVPRAAPLLGDLAAPGTPRVIAARDLDALVGPQRISREDALQFATYSRSSLNVPSGSAGIAYQVDRILGVDRHLDPCELVARLEAALGAPLRLADPYDALGVRFSAFRRAEDDGPVILLHVVNYNVPTVPHPRGRTVSPVTGLRVDLRLGAEWRVATATAREPAHDEEPLAVTCRDGVATFTIPRLEVYKLVTVRPA